MSDTARDIVLLEYADKAFGFDVKEVVRVVQAVRSVSVRHSSPAIEGVINLHGEVVPVIDLTVWIGGPPKPVGLEDLLVVLDIARCRAAVRADRARGVASIAAAEIKPAQNVSGQSAYPLSVALTGATIVFLPQLSEFLTHLAQGAPYAGEIVAA